MSVADILAVLAAVVCLLSMWMAKRAADRAQGARAESDRVLEEANRLFERIRQMRDDMRGMAPRPSERPIGRTCLCQNFAHDESCPQHVVPY
jgi:hypothetical protein